MSILNHNAINCDIYQCREEANNWFETNDGGTFYLCPEHNNQLSDDDGYYNELDTTKRIIVPHEIGVYQCNEICEVCN